MTVTLSATEVSRHFADILQRASAGEIIVVVKNGRPMAQIIPPPQANGAALLAFLDAWPGDAVGFSDDVLTSLDAVRQSNDRDAERQAWLQDSR